MTENKILELVEEIDTFDIMLTALVELLEEKGLLTQGEWERKIEEMIKQSSNQTSYRKIQFKRT